MTKLDVPATPVVSTLPLALAMKAGTPPEELIGVSPGLPDPPAMNQYVPFGV